MPREVNPHRTRSALANGEVVVVGSVNVDHVLSVARRPGPGETVGEAFMTVHRGGKGANQALAAVRSGATVRLIACVGADTAGDELMVALGHEGVSTTFVRSVLDVATGMAYITVTEDGENAIVVAPGANAHLQSSDIRVAAGAISEAAVLVAQLEIPLATVTAAVAAARPETIVVINCAPYYSLAPECLARTDVLVLNEIEATAMSERAFDVPHGAVAAAEALLSRGVAAVVMTLGEHGAAVACRSGSRLCPAAPTPAVDTSGAGDAFVGALAASLSWGAHLFEAVPFAVAVGSATIQTPGAEPQVPTSLKLPRAVTKGPRLEARDTLP